MTPLRFRVALLLLVLAAPAAFASSMVLSRPGYPDVVYDDSTAEIIAAGADHYIEVKVNHGLYVSLSAPQGSRWVRGRYPETVGPGDSNGRAYGAAITYYPIPQYGCQYDYFHGDVEIRQIGFNAHGSMDMLDATVTTHCGSPL